MQIIEEVREKSWNLLTFVSDSLSHLDKASLEGLKQNRKDMPITQDLRNRITMRLTLLADDVDANSARVMFEDTARPDQFLRNGKKNGAPVLVEYFYPPTVNDRAKGALVRQIARVAALHSEPKGREFRTLPGLGFVSESLVAIRYGFIYQLPQECVGRPYCRLSKLLAQVKLAPLDVRVSTAAALCDAFLHLHSIGWYHKGIRSDNVLIFGVGESSVRQDQENLSFADWDFSNPYFIGFDYSRPFEAETFGTVDFVTKNNIYRHPERWGRSIRYERYHDLYALGILLTEIACWRTLPMMDKTRKNFEDIQRPEDLQEFLLQVAEEKVSHAAGSRYAEGVSLCLGNRDWSKYQDWQFQKLVRENVLQPLRELSGPADRGHIEPGDLYN